MCLGCDYEIFKSWVKALNGHFSKDAIHVTDQHWKEAQHPLSPGKCESKPQWAKTEFASTKAAVSKSSKCWGDLFTADGRVNCCSHFQKLFASSSKVRHRVSTHPRYTDTPKKWNLASHKILYPDAHCSLIPKSGNRSNARVDKRINEMWCMDTVEYYRVMKWHEVPAVRVKLENTV